MRSGREKGKGKGREGRGFLAQPGAVTVRKDSYTVFTEAPPPPEDRGGIFISRSAGTAEGKTRLFPEKRSKDALSG